MWINILTAILTIVLVAVSLGIDWMLTCGIIKLITLCFSIDFSWSVATGLWLVMCLIKFIFRGRKGE